MAYYIDSAEIFRGDTGSQGDYAISDRFSELNQEMDSKINIQDFDKVATELKSDIESIGDKLENDIKDYKLTTIREMNSCLESISTKLSDNIDKVSYDLGKHIEYFSDYKTKQEEFNKNTVDVIGAIYKALKVVFIVLGINAFSILAILIYIATL